MQRYLLKVVRRLLKVENAPTIMSFLVSFGVVILDLADVTSEDTVRAALLFSVGVLALGTLVERVTCLDRIEARIVRLEDAPYLSGISQVFERRDQLPEYQNYIASAKTEILITGLALVTTTVRFLDLLEDKARSGCSIRILLIASPKDDEGFAILRSLGRMIGTEEGIIRGQIRSSLRYLERAFQRLDPVSRSKFEVRTYRLNPTYGVLAVDGGSPTGKILLALYPYQCSEVNWPTLELRPQDYRQGLYEFFYDRTKQMWLDAEPFVPPPAAMSD